jgi:hypothetical protein
MASEFDDTDFVDSDFQAAKKSSVAASPSTPGRRPPTREELDSRVGETQQRLSELKRMQEELERERASLEEARRRRTEFHTGREEMLQNLTRGLSRIEQAEFNTRRDAERLAKTLAALREALVKIQGIHDETWNEENYSIELTRALGIIDNARMEWNAARLKWALLDGEPANEAPAATPEKPVPAPLESLSFSQLCKIGLALTLPLALVSLAALGVLVFVLLGR